MLWKLSFLYIGFITAIASTTIYDVCIVCLQARLQPRIDAPAKPINSFQANQNYNRQYPPPQAQSVAEISPSMANEINGPRGVNQQTFTNQDQTTQSLPRVSLQKNTVAVNVPPATTFRPQPSNGLAQSNFYSELFLRIAPRFINYNVLISPLSLQTLLTMVNMGAVGQTSQQLTSVLGLPADKSEAAASYSNLLQTLKAKSNAQLIMANKLYFDQILGSVNPQFEQIATTAFGAAVESINFAQSSSAAELINAWVADSTRKRIQNIISPNSLNSMTQAILVNAIYFKANWAIEFSTMDTTKQDFFVSRERAAPIEMMFNDDIFRYAEIPQLQAKILDLPYANSNMSMTFILPDKVDGLLELEQQLSTMNWNRLWAQLKHEQVAIRIPKFRVEYDIEMTGPLKEMGIVDIFSESAELPLILNNNNKIHISQIQHKAVITVNEAGSEAAASSFAKFVPLSLPPQPKTFTADHPFIFMIRSPEAVLFIGHLVH